MKHQRGYSLIEVIVAFALMALAATLLLGSLSGAARQVRVADDQGRAALHAESLLATLGMDAPLAAGKQQGEWEKGRYRWSLQVAPYVEPRQAGSRLWQLDLQVRWGESAQEQLRWRTLRLRSDAVAGVTP
ncbi:general secretion pathway protein GspI [Stenotrophomonas humi]|uniref:General secretion pathway protein GspI n=1 Tax=Stenotrophomonas humi TaxID=405444 RepID=A0A0R0CAE8_9GAMM|nr:prepilin-type N-terminal cleavage/methylation domain-containing protein [Stenotrophomonas humi]KRG66293.1 general secretion pathway protein GspI [Stenotrophomonas humi]